MRKIRLDKLLSMNGISRSQALVITRSGAVTVDGKVVLNSATIVDADSCEVRLNGKKLRCDEHLHVMIHKPAGYLTATEDKVTPVIADLLPELYRKRGVGPVGRLDKDVTGLVIMTTDGQLAHRLISPKWEQDKLYRAEVEGRVGEDAVRRFAEGIPLKDFTCRPARLTVVEASDKASVCEVIVQEGKFHQVKRMFGAVGHPVTKLSRLMVAGIPLDPYLEAGQWRELTGEERDHLYEVAGTKE
jgi:16S rRNA pseudouridine516 synthase